MTRALLISCFPVLVAATYASHPPVRPSSGRGVATDSTRSKHAKPKEVPVITLDIKNGSPKDQLKRQADSARAHGQVVLVDVGAPWCGPCRMLEATFHDTAMIAALSHARVVHLDFDAWYGDLSRQGYIDAYDLPELFTVKADGSKGESFAHASWYDYADSAHLAWPNADEKGQRAEDVAVLAPPLRAFIEKARESFK